MKLEGKVAAITGGTRGIGRAIAEGILAEGGKVALNGRSEEKGAQALEEMAVGDRAIFVQGNVQQRADVDRLVDTTVETFGTIDIMVNNAGMHLQEGMVADMDVEIIDRIFSVNFKGIFFGCKYAARQMKKQKSGNIINLGSYGGKLGFPGYAAYCSSKGAVHTFTISLARELAPDHVTVNALCPGLAATEMHWSFMRAEAENRGMTFDELKDEELQTIPLGRYAEGKDMAGTIMWLSSGAGSYLTGQLINLNGGLYFA